jgi:hypothetical protein
MRWNGYKERINRSSEEAAATAGFRFNGIVQSI